MSGPLQHCVRCQLILPHTKIWLNTPLYGPLCCWCAVVMVFKRGSPKKGPDDKQLPKR